MFFKTFKKNDRILGASLGLLATGLLLHLVVTGEFQSVWEINPFLALLIGLAILGIGWVSFKLTS